MPKLRTPQIGLLSLLLIMSVIAAWMPLVLNRQPIERLRQSNAVSRASLGELTIANENELCVMEKMPLLYEHSVWSVFVPKNTDARLNLGTAGIMAKGLVDPVERVSLPAGHHEVQMEWKFNSGTKEDQSTDILISIDNVNVVHHTEPPAWKSTSFSYSSVSDASQREQRDFAIGKPFVLKRSRWDIRSPNGQSKDQPSEEPANGVLLWIDTKPLKPEAAQK